MDDKPTRTRPRHLIDPANPRPQPARSMSLSQVQRWVLSSLLLISLWHFAGGLVIAAAMLDESRTDGRVGLPVLAAFVGIAGVAGARAIHRKRVVSPWLLVGVLPAVVGAWFVWT